MQQSHQMPALLDQLRQDPGLAERLPSVEGAIVRAALAGEGVHEIAANCQTSEANVWHVLGRAARQVSGDPLPQVETGGLGSLGDEPDFSVPGGPAAGGQLDNVSGAGVRRDRQPQVPQTPHPSQAEGDAEPTGPTPQVPQTPHPSQAEGDDG